jgi:hypothetical protein
MARCDALMPSVIRVLWALPITLPGLALALLVIVLGGRAQRVDGVIEAGSGLVGRWMHRHTRFAAITLGHVVMGVDEVSLALWRVHEQAHVRQYERWGLFFPLLYLGSSLNAALHGRDPYRANRFEREARIVARRGGGLIEGSWLASYTAAHDRYRPRRKPPDRRA